MPSERPSVNYQREADRQDPLYQDQVVSYDQAQIPDPSQTNFSHNHICGRY
jgi:hypothetical protein